MSAWDVFHSDRLEIERGLTTAQVRAALASGGLTADDLVRPATSEVGWARLADFPAFFVPEPSAAPGKDDSEFAREQPQEDSALGAAQPAPGVASADEDASESSIENQAGEFPPVPSDEPPAPESIPRALQDTVPIPTLNDAGFAPPSFEDVLEDTQPLTVFDASVDERHGGSFAEAPVPPEPASEPAHDEVVELDDGVDDARDSYLDALAPGTSDPSARQDARHDQTLEAEPNEDEDEVVDLGELDLRLDRADTAVALPVERVEDREGAPWADGDDEAAWEEEYDPLEEDEAAAEFTLARGSAETVEELDLAAMVDVAFQLVLFFLVTATTVLYKSLEVPKPNPEAAAASATQGQGKTLDDLAQDYILVDVDPQGGFKIDREPVPAQMNVLVARLRAARQNTGRSAMLLTADAATLHKHAVLAYDAANEIGLRIAIARPSSAGGGGNAAAPPAPPIPRKDSSG